MYELHWGMPVILYLFLGGLGAGAAAISGSVLLRAGNSAVAGPSFDIARWGALIAPIPVMLGSMALIFELGSFQAGHWFRWIHLFLTINLSPMSIGSWLLALFILLSLAYAYTFLRKDARLGDEQHGFRRGLAWSMVVLGVCVALYTGILLGAMPSRPFWNSPILALLFLVSALSTGVAAILLLKVLFGRADTGIASHHARDSQLLATTDMLLIGFELLVVFLFILYAHLTVGSVRDAVAVILGGDLTGLFWFGFVGLGLVLPVLVEMRYVIPTLGAAGDYRIPRSLELLICVLVLIGGFMLRYVVVIAGQITGPAGI